LNNELNNLISKYKKNKHSEKDKKSEDDFPTKYLIIEIEERDSSRNSTRKNLFKYLKGCLKDEKEKEKLCEKIVKIEEKLYENYKKIDIETVKRFSKKFGERIEKKIKIKIDESYTNRVLEILHYIKDDKNTEFKQNIVDGKISPEELCTMDENKMIDQSKKDAIQEKIKDKINSLILDWEIILEDGVYTCPKCHSKKTYQMEKQMRSADEDTTIIISCAKCEENWKI